MSQADDPKPEVFDASDPAQVKARKNKAKRAQDALYGSLKAVLSTPEGKRVIWNILAESGIEADPFNSNALWMAKAVGAQGIGRYIKILISKACPEKYLEMQIFNQQEEANG